MQRNLAATYPPWARACRRWEGRGRKAAKKEEEEKRPTSDENSSSSSESLSSSAHPSTSSSSTAVVTKRRASKSAGSRRPSKRSKTSNRRGAQQAAQKEIAASRAKAAQPDLVGSNQPAGAGVPRTVSALPDFANLPTNFTGMTDVAKEALQVLGESFYLIPHHTQLCARALAVLQANGPVPPLTL